MSDFLLTISFGGLVALGGLIGYLKRGSKASLAAGVTFGSIYGLLAVQMANAPAGQSASVGVFAVRMLVSAVLMGVMGRRVVVTGKFMPAGVVAGLAMVMTVLSIPPLLQ